MTFLYVFPHPADACFGPAPAIARQVREGHDVSLLTLTKGGATTVRHDLGKSVDAMGAIREAELRAACEVLGVEVSVLDFPDGGLAGLDPREIETVVLRKIQAVQPDVLVTYAPFGTSGHPDHLTAHAVVKWAYCRAGEALAARAPKRLALFSLVEEHMAGAQDHLRGVPLGDVGALVRFEDQDLETARRALACYETDAEGIAQHDPLRLVTEGVGFVLFDETHAEPLELADRGVHVGPGRCGR